MPANRRKPTAPDYAAQAANQAGSYATPRIDYTGQSPASQYTHELQLDPNFTPPDGYSVHSNHVSQDPNGFMNFMDSKWAPILMAAGIGGLGFAPGGAFSGAGGAGGGAGAAADIGSGEAGSVPGWSGIPGSVASGASGEASGGGIGSKILSALSPRKGGLDYGNLLLGGLSLLGHDPLPYQKRESFSGTAADPVETLGTALNTIKNMGEYISTQSAPSFKSAVVPQGPSPVSIPGIPFQIGGGLGRDPAIADPSLLTGKGIGNPFKSTSTPAKKRTV